MEFSTVARSRSLLAVMPQTQRSNQRAAGALQMRDRLRQGVQDDRLEGVELELSGLGGHGDGRRRCRSPRTRCCSSPRPCRARSRAEPGRPGPVPSWFAVAPTGRPPCPPRRSPFGARRRRPLLVAVLRRPLR
jgi:hypothetical protein